MKLDVGSGPVSRRDGWVTVERWLDSSHHVGETATPDVQADAHHLPIASESIDHVRLSHVIEHLERPLDALREAHRVVAPGGTVYVEVPDASRVPAERDDHLYSWTRDTLCNIAERAGFSVKEYGRGMAEHPKSTTPMHYALAEKPKTGEV